MNKNFLFLSLCLLPLIAQTMDTPLAKQKTTVWNVLMKKPEILGQRIQGNRLNSSGLGLTSLQGIAEIPGIESTIFLDLSNNALTSIPACALESLAHLRVLHFNNNKIETIEWHAFDNLADLEELILDNNKLTVIGGQFIDRDLSSLKKLGLAHNEISKIHPHAFKDLQRLEVLDLSNNNIVHLDYKILEPLSQLRYLDVSGNKYFKLIPTYKEFILKKLAPGAEIES